MGYWLYLFEVKDGEILADNIVWETKICYNLSGRICKTHQPDRECPMIDTNINKCIHCNRPYEDKCDFVDLWDIDDDCNVRSGSDVAYRAGKALKILKDMNIYPSEILRKHPSKAHIQNKNLTYLADRIYKYRRLGQKYPDHYFLRSDKEEYLIPFDKNLNPDEYISEIDDHDDDDDFL